MTPAVLLFGVWLIRFTPRNHATVMIEAADKKIVKHWVEIMPCQLLLLGYSVLDLGSSCLYFLAKAKGEMSKGYLNGGWWLHWEAGQTRKNFETNAPESYRGQWLNTTKQSLPPIEAKRTRTSKERKKGRLLSNTTQLLWWPKIGWPKNSKVPILYLLHCMVGHEVVYYSTINHQQIRHIMCGQSGLFPLTNQAK